MTPQEELYAALSTNAGVLEYLPVTRIISEFPTLAMFGSETVNDHFPRLTFTLADRSHSMYADNEPVLDKLQFDIDIWLVDGITVTYSLNTIKLEVDKTMLSLGYFKTGEEERRIVADKISHLSLSYVKEFPSNL
jgi:hypothetical protein